VLKWIEALLHVTLANLVPIWGFTQASWSPGTTLALYWVQTAIAIPILTVLIVAHRRLTRKAGHYAGTSTTRDSRGIVTTRRATFLEGFLWMSIPFTLAHGVFLAVLLGLLWKDAIDPSDLRTGTIGILNVLAFGFAIDMLSLRNRSFAWIEQRAGTVMQRTLVVHLAIIFGMALAAFTGRDVGALFGVFLALKVLMDVLSELPAYDPKEAPAWLARLANRLADKGKGEDFAAEWRRQREAMRKNAALAEQTIESLDAGATSGER